MSDSEHLEPDHAGLLGTLIDGKYAVERVIGEGGMGVVYLARDIHIEVPVVLKAIRGEHAHRKQFRDRILAEGRALARIDHPNVVRLNAIVVERGALYLVMQLVEGESLADLIARRSAEGQPLPLREAVHLFRQVVEGVAAAHREGIIHRDLKPANVLVRARDGAVKVSDFGIAKTEEDAREGRGQTSGVLGSASYMSPEQCLGVRTIDKRTDIYALGIVFFELLAGRVPFEAPSAFEIMAKQVSSPLPRLTELAPHAPRFAGEIVARACAKERDERFASCEELLAALDRGVASLAAQGGDAARSTPAAALDDAGRASPGAAAAPGAGSAGPPGAPVATVRAGPVEPASSSPPAGLRPREQDPTPAPVSRLPGGDGPPARAAWARAVALATALAGVALGIGYALGWLPSVRPKRSPGASPRVVAAPAPLALPSAAGESPPPEDAAAALAGAWRSDSGRVYDAAWNGSAVEFRIRDASQFPSQGYVEGEARFALRPLPGDGAGFSVEDRIRPIPPDGVEYDLQRARASCVETWSEVGGKPLRAALEGDRLKVKMAVVAPTPAMFELAGRRAVGCNGLSRARAAETESTLTRY